eukprot:4290311-Pyramimonas_sp.AAC.1
MQPSSSPATKRHVKATLKSPMLLAITTQLPAWLAHCDASPPATAANWWAPERMCPSGVRAYQMFPLFPAAFRP